MNWDTNLLGIMTVLLLLISIRLYAITKELDCMHDHLHNLDHNIDLHGELIDVGMSTIHNTIRESNDKSESAEEIEKWDNGE